MTYPWQRNNDSSSGAILLAFLAGAGAGLTAGILLAPKSGERLRSEIGDSVGDYLESARQTAAGLKTSAINITERGLKDAQRAKDHAVAVLKDDVRGAVETGGAQAHNAIDRTEAALQAGAKKSHETVSEVVNAARTGTNG